MSTSAAPVTGDEAPQQGFFTPDALGVALVALLAYLAAYAGHIATPASTWSTWTGWFDWSDQGTYLGATRALAELRLPGPKEYVYPIGYPFLGALFYWLLPRHPYLIPNAFFAVGSVVCFYVAAKTVLTRIESFLLALLLIVFSGFARGPATIGYLVWQGVLIVPWNVIPAFFAAYLTACVAVFRKPTLGALGAASAAIAVAFACRPSDALFPGLLYLAALPGLAGWKRRTGALATLGAACGVVLLLVTWSKLAVFGNMTSPYEKIVLQEQGFGPSRLLFKLYLLFLDGTPGQDYPDPMLVPQMPWLVLGIPGLLLFARERTRKAYGLAAAMLACVLLYVSYNAMAPSNIYRYHGYRYLAWTFPWLGLFAWLFVTRGWCWGGRRFVGWASVLTLLACLVPGWKDIRVARSTASGEPARRDATAGRASRRPTLRHEVRYSRPDRRFQVTLALPEPLPVDAVRLHFTRCPSYDLQVAARWGCLEVWAEGQPLKLFRHWNPNQNGDVVTIAARNAWGEGGRVRKIKIVFHDTDEPALETVTLVRCAFRPFTFPARMAKLWEESRPPR